MLPEFLKSSTNDKAHMPIIWTASGVWKMLNRLRDLLPSCCSIKGFPKTLQNPQEILSFKSEDGTESPFSFATKAVRSWAMILEKSQDVEISSIFQLFNLKMGESFTCDTRPMISKHSHEHMIYWSQWVLEKDRVAIWVANVTHQTSSTFRSNYKKKTLNLKNKNI